MKDEGWINEFFFTRSQRELTYMYTYNTFTQNNMVKKTLKKLICEVALFCYVKMTQGKWLSRFSRGKNFNTISKMC